MAPAGAGAGASAGSASLLCGFVSFTGFSSAFSLPFLFWMYVRDGGSLWEVSK